MSLVNHDMTADLLRWFNVDANNVVRWVDKQTAIARGIGLKQTKRLHVGLAGNQAGGKPVYGHGHVMTCQRRVMLSGDVRRAIQDGFAWPWETGRLNEFEPFRADYAKNLQNWLQYDETWKDRPLDHYINFNARDMFRLRGGRLLWAKQAGRDHQEGDEVSGALLSHPRGKIVFYRQIGFLFSDLEYMLTNDKWPWQVDNPDGW